MLERGRHVGRYRVEALLGQGGMGSVYRAFDTRLERAVALKVIPRSGDASEARFLREAKAIAALTHPNAVVVHDVGEAEDVLYIAMELVDGQTLGALAASDAPVELRLRWLVDAARALDAAHRIGIVHRDVKPDNVMVAQDGRVKVLDFGIARRAEAADATVSLTGTGAVVGTPLYMSPEQLRGEVADARSDQFSWGVMAYELLAGAPPWSRDQSTFALVGQILGVEAPPLAGRVSGLPEEAASVVARALSKDPAARFESLGELADRLEPMAAKAVGVPRVPTSAPVTATPRSRSDEAFAPTIEAPSTGTKRRGGAGSRRLAVGLALLALAAAGGVAWRATRGVVKPIASASITPPAPSATPPVEPCTPEAQKLYLDGIEAWETRSLWEGNSLWQGAVKADPACSPAWLRLALGVEINGRSLSDARQFYSGAREHPERLTPTQRELLDAIAPYVAMEPDADRAHDNLVALGLRHPDDALVQILASWAIDQDVHPAEARAAYERVLALRPRVTSMYVFLAGLEKDQDAKDRWLDRCIALMPRATWCWEQRAAPLKRGTDCAAFERFAQKAVAENPDATSARLLLEALLSVHAPREAVEEANRTEQERLSKEIPLEDRRGNDDAAVLYGDYAAAEATLRANPDMSKPDFAVRAGIVEALARILDDTGRRAEADALVRKTVLSARAMTQQGDMQWLASFFVRALAAGAMTREEVRTRLGPPRPVDSSVAWQQWYVREALLAATPDEARAALSKMPPLPWETVGGGANYQAAEVYALAGDLAAARERVDLALRKCNVEEWAYDVPHAYLLQGHVAEKQGDHAAAREAYQTVVDRWGGLKPRAVLAEDARARLRGIAGK